MSTSAGAHHFNKLQEVQPSLADAGHKSVFINLREARARPTDTVYVSFTLHKIYLVKKMLCYIISKSLIFTEYT